MQRITMSFLGGFEVLRGGKPLAGFRSSKARALLAYLAAESDRPHSRERLAGLFWPDYRESYALAYLRQGLSNLRTVLGDRNTDSPVLLATSTALQLNPQAGVLLDVDALRESSTTATAPITDEEAICLEHGVSLYRGPFLEGFHLDDSVLFDDWLTTTRENLHVLAVDALARLAEYRLRRGDVARGLDHARRLVELEPEREESRRILMRVLALAGRPSEALEQYAALRDLLRAELRIQPDPETVRLADQIRRGELHSCGAITCEAVVMRPDMPARDKLPFHSLPLVGRVRELAEITACLVKAECRLLTLVGPGGIGKTRLAQAVAEACRAARVGMITFEHGVHFVPLVAAAEFSDLLSSISDALGLRPHSDAAPEQQLLDYLREKRLLLLLDNFEQLASGAVQDSRCMAFLAAILAEAPRVKLLVTSRVALGSHDSWTYRVNGMALPRCCDGGPDAAREALESEAAQLFIRSALRADAAFVATEHCADVIRICRLVNGSPLAIEMSAAWMGALPARRVADELERGLDILEISLVDVPERHRSMRAVLEHSWNLVSEQERSALSRMAVFRGRFSPEAAKAVAGASLRQLADLVGKSLVQADEDDYFVLHETLRQFALEKLAAAGESNATQDAHSAYYLGLTQSSAADLNGSGQQRALDKLAHEIANVRQAWRWAASRGARDALAAAMEGLYLWHQVRGCYVDGCDLFAHAIALLGPAIASGDPRASALKSRLAARLGALSRFIGDFDAAERLLTDCLAADSSRPDVAFILGHLAEIVRQHGEGREARRLLLRSLDLYRQSADAAGAASVLVLLAFEELSIYGRLDEAKRYAVEAMEAARRSGRPDTLATAILGLNWVCWCLGQYDEIQANLPECVLLGQQIGDPFVIAEGLCWLGRESLRLEDPSGALFIAYMERALAIYREIGHRPYLGMKLSDLAEVLLDVGRPERALAAARESLAIAEATANVNHKTLSLIAVGAAESSLGEWQAGQRHLLEGIRLAWRHHIPGHLLKALWYYASSLRQEADEAEIDSKILGRRRKQSLELAAFLADCPQVWVPYRERASGLKRYLETQFANALDADLVTRAEALDLEQVVEGLLGG